MRSSRLLEARDLSYATPSGRLLAQGVSFAVSRGEIVAVIGPNGTGKSTLLRVVLGEVRPTAGIVESTATSVSFLSQLHNREFHIPLRLSDVLALSFRGRLQRSQATRFGLLSDHDLALAWNTASGGERQKTLLTQTLLAEPELLVLDEPMNHLDTQARQTLAGVLRDFVADGTRGVLMVCHEQGLSTSACTVTSPIDLAKYTRA